MAIDLKTNKEALVKAYEQVIDYNDETDWALFGYEGQTSVLKVMEIGSGGFEEFVEELSSGKMMYIYCRIQDTNTGLFKFVLIHWTGEGVPENQRLKYTSHLRDVQSFLKSVHITIPAYNEEDIDKEDITNRVARSSGANYSYHKEKSRPLEPSGPVGTDYHRIIPSQEINLGARDQFWAKTEKDEQARREREKAKFKEERKRAESERIEREMRETKEREKRISEHVRDVNRQRKAEKKAELEKIEAEMQKWEESQKEANSQVELHAHSCSQLRKERAAEVAHLVSSSATSARDFFKQKAVEPTNANIGRAAPPPRKIFNGLCDWHEEKRQMSPVRQQQDAPQKPARQLQFKREENPEQDKEQLQASTPESEYELEPESSEKPESPSLATSPVYSSLEVVQDALLPLQDSHTVSDSQDLEESPTEGAEQQDLSSPTDYRFELHFTETESELVSDNKRLDDLLEDKEFHISSMGILKADQGKCARALYDYQAADDSEISFDPDDIITNIEEIDEGWWQGFTLDGSYGMFPANYVELLE